MDQKTTGTVISVSKQWWLKVNTKAFRTHPQDGAIFPHVIKVQYTIDGTTYTKRKWINPGLTVPPVGSQVTVLYSAQQPSRAKIL